MHKLVYTDENDLRIYESMPAEAFKEFFMAYFNYKKGDNVTMDNFTNPMTYSMFLSYIPKLDKNEETYSKKVTASKENGKKGGRPRKNVETQNKTVLTPQNDIVEYLYQPEVETLSNGLKNAKNEDFEKDLKPVVQEIENELISDEEKYGSTVMDLLEQYGEEIDKALNDYVDYNFFNDMNKELLANSATNKIRTISINYGLTPNTNEWNDLNRYCKDTIEYYKHNKQIDKYAEEYAA